MSQTSYGNLIEQPSPADSRQSSYADYDNLLGRAPSGGDSSFYTKQPDYGIIPKKQTKPKYLHEFRNEIAGYDDELAKLHKQQYHTMVYEQDGKKLDELAERQAQLEKEKAVLKDRYYSAMGIGSEGKSGSENMLIGEGNNPNFSYDFWDIDKYKIKPDEGFDRDKGDEEYTLPDGTPVKIMPDKGFDRDWGEKEYTLPDGKRVIMNPDKGFDMDWSNKEYTLPDGKRVTTKPDKGFNMDWGEKTINFNGKTYEVAPNGEAREVPNTKPRGTMEDIRLYPKGQSPFDVGYFDEKGINPQPYIIDPNEKPKDMRQYLMADTKTDLFEGVKGKASAFLGASVTDDEKEGYTQQIEQIQKKIEQRKKEINESYALLTSGAVNGDEFDQHQQNYNNGLDEIQQLEDEIKALERENAAFYGSGGPEDNENNGDVVAAKEENGIDSNVQEICNNKEFQDAIKKYTLTPEEVVSGITGEIGKLSIGEAALAVSNPLAAFKVNDNKTLAEKFTKQYFGKSWNEDTTEANAFKHAIWQALNSRSLGPDLAIMFASAHENKPKNDSNEEYLKTTLYNATNMDLQNNAIGIAIGSSINNDLSTDEVAEIVYQIVIEQGKGIWDGHGMD